MHRKMHWKAPKKQHRTGAVCAKCTKKHTLNAPKSTRLMHQNMYQKAPKKAASHWAVCGYRNTISGEAAGDSLFTPRENIYASISTPGALSENIDDRIFTIEYLRISIYEYLSLLFIIIIIYLRIFTPAFSHPNLSLRIFTIEYLRRNIQNIYLFLFYRIKMLFW